MYILGTGLNGKVDQVANRCHVATEFFHVLFLPFYPIRSWVIVDGSVDGGILMAQSWRGLEIPRNQKSIGFAWTRALLVMLGISFVSAAVMAGADTGYIRYFGLLFGGAVYLSYRTSHANSRREAELLRILDGVGDAISTQSANTSSNESMSMIPASAIQEGQSLAERTRTERWNEFRTSSNALRRELATLRRVSAPALPDALAIPLPANAPAVDSLGDLLGAVRFPGASWLMHHCARPAALVICIFALIVGSALLLAGVFDLDSRKARSSNIFIGLMALAQSSVGFFLVSRSNFKPAMGGTLWVFESGLLLGRGRFTTVAWEDVREFQTSERTGRPMYWLTLKSESIALSAGFGRNVTPLMEFVEDRVAAARFVELVERI